jgi:hypothetical protein
LRSSIWEGKGTMLSGMRIKVESGRRGAKEEAEEEGEEARGTVGKRASDSRSTLIRRQAGRGRARCRRGASR